MQINRIAFKNFRSYGNRLTTIDFSSDEGNLILLTGENGSGKSSIRDVILWSLFDKVPSQKGTTSISPKTLVNFISKGEMSAQVDFSVRGSDYKIHRFRKGNKPLVEAFKDDTQVDFKDKKDWIESEIGFTYDLFKNFIFISISDFKNILKLKKEDKRKLLDKLFNFEVLNQLNEENKVLDKENKKNIQSLEGQIQSIQRSISDVIEAYKRKKAEQEKKDKIEGDKLKADLDKYKADMETYSNSIKDYKEKKEKGVKFRDETSKKISEASARAAELKKKIKLFEEHKVCPVCGSDISENLSDEHIKEIKDEYMREQETLKKGEKTMDKIRERMKELESEITKSQDKLYDLKSLSSTITKQLELLEDKDIEKDDKEESQKLVQKWKSEIKANEDKLEMCHKKAIAHADLSLAFSEKGVKRKMIHGILDPLNTYLNKYLTDLDFVYNVELDEDFNAVCQHMGKEIDIYDTFSSGEINKTVICLLLSYMELIQIQKPVNIIFLDELFGNLDSNNVTLVLKILRDFAKRNKMNIFIVHHARLDETLFDKIMHVEKQMFSEIDIIDIEN